MEGVNSNHQIKNRATDGDMWLGPVCGVLSCCRVLCLIEQFKRASLLEKTLHVAVGQNSDAPNQDRLTCLVLYFVHMFLSSMEGKLLPEHHYQGTGEYDTPMGPGYQKNVNIKKHVR